MAIDINDIYRMRMIMMTTMMMMIIRMIMIRMMKTQNGHNSANLKLQPPNLAW